MHSMISVVAILTALVAFTEPVSAQKGRGGKGETQKAASAPEADKSEARKGPKRYPVNNARAIVITRDVLVRQGFLVEKVDEGDGVTVVWYRRGNMGKGKGKGPLEKMVIRKVENAIVFEQAPPAILVDIDVRLKL